MAKVHENPAEFKACKLQQHQLAESVNDEINHLHLHSMKNVDFSISTVRSLGLETKTEIDRKFIIADDFVEGRL